MLSGNDSALAKEEARIQLKRAQNEKRKERFLSARTRLIGVDVDALDAQVAEMQRLKSDTKEADRVERECGETERAMQKQCGPLRRVYRSLFPSPSSSYPHPFPPTGIRQLEIERVLEAAAEEERMLKQFTANEVRRNWESAIEMKRNVVPETVPDPLVSGASAAQNFAGNDPNKVERIRMQQEQMRRWVQEQVAEKAHLSQMDKESSKSYSDMLKAIEEIRDVAEKEEQDMRKYLMRSVKEQNDVLAASRHKRWNDEKLAWTSLPLELKAAATSIDLKEDQELAIDETGESPTPCTHARLKYPPVTQPLTLFFPTRPHCQEGRLPGIQPCAAAPLPAGERSASRAEACCGGGGATLRGQVALAAVFDAASHGARQHRRDAPPRGGEEAEPFHCQAANVTAAAEARYRQQAALWRHRARLFRPLWDLLSIDGHSLHKQ